jgi:hypothetical protein
MKIWPHELKNLVTGIENRIHFFRILGVWKYNDFRYITELNVAPRLVACEELKVRTVYHGQFLLFKTIPLKVWPSLNSLFCAYDIVYLHRGL